MRFDDVAAVPDCRFCLANGLLYDKPVDQTDNAYLLAMTGHKVEGCYLIIPIVHCELGLPSYWQEEVNLLLPSIPWYEQGVPFNLSTNFGGEQSGQRQKHLHDWVIPRTNPQLGNLGLASLLAEKLPG